MSNHKLLISIAFVSFTSALLQTNSSIDERILESSAARDGEIPSMAQLVGKRSNGNVWHCAGAILSNRFVLTTAVCGRTAPRDTNILTGSTERLNGSSVPIAQIIVHPEFAVNGNVIVHNLALILTGQEIQFNDYVYEAVLPVRPLVEDGRDSTVRTVGWGANSVRKN